MLKATRTINPQAPIIEVVPYNPNWPEKFAKESAKIRQALGENCIMIHHIGSTSIPGLAAKPVIDMVPVVKDILEVDSSSLEKLGYVSRGEYGMLFRRFFSTSECHVHIWEEGNAEIEKHLLFRDYLKGHSQDFNRYESLKRELAQNFRTDRTSYSLAKDDLVREILQKAGFQGLTMVQAFTDREWSAVKSMRQRCFFDRVDLQDPYTWTFEDDKHFHIVLMKGCEIIGYAHLQFWPDNRAALRIIVIEEAYRGKGVGGEFLKKLERWLSHQNIKSLHTQSSKEAYAFYKKLGYVEMPFNDPDGYESDPQDIDMGKIL